MARWSALVVLVRVKKLVTMVDFPPSAFFSLKPDLVRREVTVCVATPVVGLALTSTKSAKYEKIHGRTLNKLLFWV